MWVMVLFIGGKLDATFEARSEAACRVTQERVMAVMIVRGQKAESACYLKATTAKKTG